jgi:hypothetical protein
MSCGAEVSSSLSEFDPVNGEITKKAGHKARPLKIFLWTLDNHFTNETFA